MKTFISIIVLLFGEYVFAQLGNNPYGNDSNSYKIYDANGNYRGNLNRNQYDPNSISNPYGQYGNHYSPTSIKNPYVNPGYARPRHNHNGY